MMCQIRSRFGIRRTMFRPWWPQPKEGDHECFPELACPLRHQAHPFLVPEGPARHLADRTRRDRGGHGVVGRGSVLGQTRLEQAAQLPQARAVRRGTDVPGRPGRKTLRHAERLADPPRRRPARECLGLHPGQRLHGDDHSQGARRPRLLGADAQPCGDEDREPQRGGRRHRDGAQLARTRRASDALRHRCAAQLLSAAPRGRSGNPLLRADRAGSGIGRRLHPRSRRGLLRRAQGQPRARASRSPGTSATSRLPRSRRFSASPSASTIPTI